MDMVKVMHAVSIMNRAGQETFIMNMYRNINRNKIQFGFQCSVSGEGDFDDEIRRLGGKIYHLEENKCQIPFLKYLNEIRIQYRFFKKHNEYSVYHIHTYHAFNAWLSIVGAKMAGVQKVVLHSHNTFGMHPQLHKIFRTFLKYMKIERLACSKKAAEWMYGEKEVSRVKVINNGIDTESFVFQQEEREKKRKELGLEKKTIIGHIGRFMPQKNHEFIIDIFSEISKKDENAVLLLIGEGELLAEIKDQVESKNLTGKVYFLGVRSDIQELLWAMDLFLFPSVYEGLGIVVVEAQAAGLPVLTSTTLPEETKITNNIQYMSLNDLPSTWAEQALIMSKLGHDNTLDDLKKANYDMKQNIDVMLNVYLGE